MDTIEYTSENARTLLEAVCQGARPADLAGLSQDYLEQVYALAYQYYSVANYSDAETLFKGLCFYDQGDPRFWMGLGACRQTRGDFDGAITAYDLAAVSGALGDPAPVLHAAICYLKKGESEMGRDLLKVVGSLGESDRPEHQALRAKAEALLAAGV